MFSCTYFEIFKNTDFEDFLRTTAFALNRGADRIWKGQGYKPEKRAQFILSNMLIFTFIFKYLIFYKRLFFCFQQNLKILKTLKIFDFWNFWNSFRRFFLINIWATLCMSMFDIRCRGYKFRSLSLLSSIVLWYGVFNCLIPDASI